MFSKPEAEAVFREYEERHAEELKLMASLGPKGMSRRDEFLLPIGPEVGRFLHSLIMAQKPKRIIELGTSYGYSTLFLADAASQVGAEVISFDIADYKQTYAAEMMEKAGLLSNVTFRLGDAVQNLRDDQGQIDFVLMDIWKELYVPCLEAVLPTLSDEGIIAADNMFSPPIHIEMARRYRSVVEAHPELQTALLPIGSGIEITTRWTKGSAKL